MKLKQNDPDLRPKFLKGVIYHFDGGKNVITDKNNNVVMWCDARRSRVYVGWQRFKIFIGWLRLKQSIKSLRS